MNKIYNMFTHQPTVFDYGGMTEIIISMYFLVIIVICIT